MRSKEFASIELVSRQEETTPPYGTKRKIMPRQPKEDQDNGKEQISRRLKRSC